VRFLRKSVRRLPPPLAGEGGGMQLGSDGGAATRGGQHRSWRPEDLRRLPRARLYTTFGTAIYVDPDSSELRHGPAGSSLANALYACPGGLFNGSGPGWILHQAAGSLEPVVGGHERCHASAVGVATEFEGVAVDRCLLGLRANGRYLCAEPDGRVTLSRAGRGPWETFLALEEELTCANPVDAPDVPGLTKYHLGCGSVIVAGYLNIDYRGELVLGALCSDFEGKCGAFFLNHNLADGIPGRDRSLDVIYHCHFLEHLPYLAGIRLLRQARNRLKPGAIMRLLVPDLALWIEHYQCNNVAFFEAYRRSILDENKLIYNTKGSIFMGMLHNHGHQCGYDFETIKWILEFVGFTEVRQTLFQESAIPEIASLEPYSPLRGMESLCVECIRPYEPG
jgi:hypothetical protein